VNVIADHQIEALRFKLAPEPAIVYVDDVEWWKAQLNYSFEGSDIVLTHVPMGSTNVKLYFKDQLRPTAIFSIMDTNTYNVGQQVYGYINKEISFNASASNDDADSGTIVKYEWDFGDDSFAMGKIANHTYSEPGEYIVNLTITDNYDLINNTNQSIIIVATPPEALFSIMENNTYVEDQQVYGYVNKEITFNASASNDDADMGSIMEYEWDFGDESFATGKIGKHTYSESGEYNVVLTCTDDIDLVGNTTQSIIIVAFPPEALFSIMDVNKEITFNASASNDDVDMGTIIEYNWNFSDDSYDTGEIVVHTFSAPGLYNITLSVTDDVGLINNYTLSIMIVGMSPTANFTILETNTYMEGQQVYGYTNKDVTFDASDSNDDADSGTIENYAWTFGDSSQPGAGKIVKHRYSQPGTYPVKLKVTDNFGLSDEYTTIVIIVEPEPENDKDGDGMDDDWELNNSLDPNDKSDQNGDLDNDGLTNWQEFLHKTSPILADTDNDGMTDSWEVQYGLNPLINDAQNDKDGDGYSNLDEFSAKTNPIDNGSYPPKKETDGEERTPTLLMIIIIFIVILVILGIIFAIRSRRSEEKIDEEFDEDFEVGVPEGEVPTGEEVEMAEGVAATGMGAEAVVEGAEMVAEGEEEGEAEAYECPECNGTIYEDQDTCANCGAPLEWEDSGEEYEEEEVEDETISEYQEELGAAAGVPSIDEESAYEEDEFGEEGDEDLFECPTCGASVAEDDIVCPSCGEEFE
jgi:PKD repeat protein